MLATAATDTFHLAWYSFNTGGAADPQGWTSVDLTTQIDTFFHVADATELDGGDFGGLIPLEGAQSMWCGQAPSPDPRFCGWAALPGYGNGWDQILVSDSLPGDSVRISYKVFWESEPGYDGTTVEYSGNGGLSWTRWPVGVGFTARPNVYDRGPQTLIESFTAGGLTAVQLRYRFQADGAWSDEDGLWPTDGAVIIDSITVECYNGGVLTSTFFEDFEGETPGATVTDDGFWTATTPLPFGDFAALYPGTAVVQEDPCFTNITHFWGWFDDPANSNYSCAGFPMQGSWPFGRGDCEALQGEIQSPRIPYTGTGDEVILSLDVYRDMPVDNLQFYVWHVRSWVGGCPGVWGSENFVYFGGQKDWFNASFSVGQHIDPGATEIQISIGVVDMCPVWCIFLCSGKPEGACRSHAPLIDNIHIQRINVVGPQYSVRHIDLFQDNFAQDGTLTGSARADAADDIAPSFSPTIRPGDSITIDVTDVGPGLTIDPFTGVGPSVYAYVTVLPPGQPGKSGPELEAPESRAIGKRFPLADSVSIDGTTWYCFRMDTVLTPAGAIVADRYAFDLNDNVFTPGDTVLYFLSAMNGGSLQNYWSRRLNGQGDNFVTEDLLEAAGSPLEFTILPAGGNARGGDILYVDDTDDRGGPAQLFFDTAFDYLQLRDLVDRYDVLGPSSAVGNSLGARVRNIATQIVGPYRKIIWNSGDLSSNLINDGGWWNGGGSADKSPDFAVIFEFLDTHPNNPGFYASGDDLPSNWANVLTGANAVNTRSIYMNFNLDPAAPTGNHVAAGEPVSPVLDGVGPATLGEQLIAFGGCPTINDFDLLQPTGGSGADMVNAATGKAYILSQSTLNSVGTAARVVLSGFSFHNIRDLGPPGSVPVRATHLYDILTVLFNVVPPPTGFDEAPQFVNRLEANYPNPFNPVTRIRYSIRERGHVSLRIYNAAGQL
ncbi:MAG: hypothetical protein V3V49_12515, partial [Candidatus Krumholzibacteria bacterium]